MLHDYFQGTLLVLLTPISVFSVVGTMSIVGEWMKERRLKRSYTKVQVRR